MPEEKQKKITKADVGRPTVMTQDTLNKLEEVWAIGGTDLEAIFYADISHQTLYDYQEKHPEFIERKEKLKERPILKARQTIVKSLDEPEHAKWYLERKAKREFAERKENVNVTIPIPLLGGDSIKNADTSNREITKAE